jgi:hypothetical protein
VTRIDRIEWATLVGRRPRASGSNSRVGPDEAPSLGFEVRVPLARVTTSDGASGFAYVEWDEATTPGLDASAYRVIEGRVHLPDTPGFGLDLDGSVFERAVGGSGYSVRG